MIQPVLPPAGTWLGIDVGRKRIGLSFSNTMHTLAYPLPALQRTSWTHDQKIFQQIIDEHQISAFVLGLPLSLDGTAGRAVDSVHSFGDLLTKAFPLPLFYQDERLTTVQAERDILTARQGRQQRMSKKDSTNYVDSAAATIILQTFLDARHRYH